MIANTPGVHPYDTILTIVSDTARTFDIAMTTHLQEIAHTTSSATAITPSGNPVAVNIISKAQLQASPVQNSLDKTIETLPGIVQFSYNEPVANGFTASCIRSTAPRFRWRLVRTSPRSSTRRTSIRSKLCRSIQQSTAATEWEQSSISSATARATSLRVSTACSAAVSATSNGHRQPRHVGAVRIERSLP